MVTWVLHGLLPRPDVKLLAEVLLPNGKRPAPSKALAQGCDLNSVVSLTRRLPDLCSPATGRHPPGAPGWSSWASTTTTRSRSTTTEDPRTPTWRSSMDLFICPPTSFTLLYQNAATAGHNIVHFHCRREGAGRGYLDLTLAIVCMKPREGCARCLKWVPGNRVEWNHWSSNTQCIHCSVKLEVKESHKKV